MTGKRALQAAPRGRLLLPPRPSHPVPFPLNHPEGREGEAPAEPLCHQFRGLESNQHQRVQSPMSYQLDDPGINLSIDTAQWAKVRGEGIEPSSAVSRTAGLPLADPRECPAGVEPAFPAWKTGAFAARPRAREVSRRKERESNPQGSSLDRFQDGCHRQLACPSEKLR